MNAKPLWRGRDPLLWLLDPIGLDRFLDGYWERDKLIVRRDGERYFDELLDFDAVNEFMARNDIRYPYLRLVKNGRELPLVDYADDFLYGSNVFPGLLDSDKVFHHYAEGATLSFQIFQKCMPELSAFCNAMEARLGFQTQVNIFVTPPNSKGFTAHYDDHSFFIMQVAGSKHWTLYGNPVELPLREWRASTSTPADLGGQEEITLQTGDLLYLPKGFYHEARTSDETSIHITLGIFPFMWIQIFEKLLSELKRDVDFRRSPVALLRGQGDDRALQTQFDVLARKFATGDVSQLLKSLIAETASKQIVIGENRLRDLSELGKLEGTTRVERREGVFCRVDVSDTVVEVRIYDKKIALPLAARESMEFVLRSKVFTATDLPNCLDAQGNLVLVRKLVKEGLLTILV